jgi:hypothetical protein
MRVFLRLVTGAYLPGVNVKILMPDGKQEGVE